MAVLPWLASPHRPALADTTMSVGAMVLAPACAATVDKAEPRAARSRPSAVPGVSVTVACAAGNPYVARIDRAGERGVIIMGDGLGAPRILGGAAADPGHPDGVVTLTVTY